MTTHRYTLELTTPATPDGLGRSPEQRLRQALKRLGRDFGLRCVSITVGGAPAEANQRRMHQQAEAVDGEHPGGSKSL